MTRNLTTCTRIYIYLDSQSISHHRYALTTGLEGQAKYRIDEWAEDIQYLNARAWPCIVLPSHRNPLLVSTNPSISPQFCPWASAHARIPGGCSNVVCEVPSRRGYIFLNDTRRPSVLDHSSCCYFSSLVDQCTVSENSMNV